jgi:transcriptional accessory protein Tex/SPT6
MEIKQKFLKVYFEKFYGVTGHEMLKIIEEKHKKEDLLDSQPLSHLILKRYHQMNKMETLYCHFFKKNTTKNDETIQNGKVELIEEKRNISNEQNLLHMQTGETTNEFK